MTQEVVYLHGFASSPKSEKATYFAAQFAALGFTFAVPDLAAGEFESLTITGQLRLLDGLLSGRPAVLMGSSLGGYVASLYASRHSEIPGAVLLAPAFRFARRWRELLGPSAVDEWRRTGTRTFYHYGTGREERLSYRFLEDADRYEDFPRTTQPVLVIHGRRDEVVPLALSEAFVRAQADARLIILDSDHQLLNVTSIMWADIYRFVTGPADRGQIPPEQP